MSAFVSYTPQQPAGPCQARLGWAGQGMAWGVVPAIGFGALLGLLDVQKQVAGVKGCL